MSVRVISNIKNVFESRIHLRIASTILLVLALSACSSEAPVANDMEPDSLATSSTDDTNAFVSQPGFSTVAANTEVPELGLAQSAVDVTESDVDVTSPVLIDLSVSEISSESVRITWVIDEPATGQILYGTNDNTNLSSKEEKSFNFTTHSQTLTGLSAGKEYSYKVVSVDESGNRYESALRKISTVEIEQQVSVDNTDTPNIQENEAETPIVAQVETPIVVQVETPIVVQIETPEVVQVSPTPMPLIGASLPADLNYENDHLPLGGLFYGTPKGGMQAGNGPLAFENAIRFRAERSGTVQAMRYNNRRLLPTDINDRCDVNGPGSDWCNCKDAGLDNRSCGYTLSNSYHVGSGGLITIELRTDDGSQAHLPSSVVLARTQSYEPVEVSAKFPTMTFNTPVQVQAGQIYHLVFRNDKPPVNCKLRLATPAEAAACPRDQGAIGLNGSKHATDPSEDGPFGPYLGKTGKGLHVRRSVGGAWILHDDVVAFHELQYSDGEYVGDTYVGVENSNYGNQTGTRTIEGPSHARQLITVEDATREVNGLWMQIGHPIDRPINNRPLQVQVKDSSGVVLASGELPASQECSDMSVENGKDKTRALRDEWMCRTWVYTDLNTPVSLLEGSQYSVEFSAAAGAAFDLSTFISVHRQDERNMWENAVAEHSTDSGLTWEPWATTWSERDLPMLFTTVGGPKTMP